MEWITIVTLFAILIIFYVKSQITAHKRREEFIDTYTFPKSINEKIRKIYPHLTQGDLDLVVSTLRDYFHVCNIAGSRVTSMPSQVVDVAWHEFILFTKEYKCFCTKALGRFLHHTPAEAMKTPTLAQAGIKRVWRISCHRVGINHKLATSLPTLFAIDSTLNIDDGFKYSLDCTRSNDGEYCASHIGCGSGCSGGSEGESDGGGCSGGCGS